MDGGSGGDARSDATKRPPGPDSGSDTSDSRTDDGAKDAAADLVAVKDHATKDATCTADTKTDPHNCGSCGHDCIGGACMSGECQPLVISSSYTPVELAVQTATSTLYWTSGMTNTLYSCTLPACSTPGNNAGGCQDTLGIAVDDANYYFTCFMGMQVYPCPNAGCGGPLPSPPYPTGVTVDSVGIYWLIQQGAPPMATGMHTGQVMSAPKDGGMPMPLRMNQNFPSSIAVESGKLYWTEMAGGLVSSCTVAMGCSDYAQILGGQKNPDQIAVDASYFFVTDNGMNATSGDGSVVRAKLDGTMATTLAGARVFPRGIAVDATYVYWVDFGVAAADGTVNRVPIAGGAVEPLATGQGQPIGIAVDDTAIYWTNNGTGQIVRLAK
jgi:hypothetical protein